MVNLANLMTASDSHWATTDWTQEKILMLIIFLAMSIGTVMGLLIAHFIYKEFRGQDPDELV